MPNTLRLPYAQLAPEAYQAMLGLSQALHHGPLDSRFIELIWLRVSQLNGCAYCVDLHWRELIGQDADPRRLNSLSIWAESPFFDAREKAALQWAEAVTLTAGRTLEDESFAQLRAQFTDAEIAQLGFAIACMNAWNRLAIPFRQPVPMKA